ncbi:MAG: hypothetical protein HYZ53_10250 [Planctomycetes bacterium]|nr:hypothetical protein [Planctomycetota bacterium]
MSEWESGLLLRSRLGALRRRRTLLEVTDAFLTAAFYAFFALACLALLDRIRLEVLPGGTPYSSARALVWVSVVAAFGCLLCGALQGVRELPPDAGLARDYDREMRLEDRFASALDGLLRGAPPDAGPRQVAFRAALLRDAERVTRDFRPAAVYRFRPLGYRWTAIAALLIALWISVVPIPRPRLAPHAGASAEEEEPPERGARPPHKPDGALGDPEPAGGRGEGKGGGAVAGVPAKPAGRPEPSADPAGGGGGGQSGAGKGSPEELLGDPERNASRKLPKAVDPLFGEGKANRREVEVYEGDAAAPAAGQDSSPLFRSQLQKYQRVAEDTLAREAIPSEEREYVKRYFEAIQPK